MPEATPLRELIPGVRYRLELEDCCIQGKLTGVFQSYALDEDGEADEAVFDIGVLGPLWGQWEAVADA